MYRAKEYNIFYWGEKKHTSTLYTLLGKIKDSDQCANVQMIRSGTVHICALPPFVCNTEDTKYIMIVSRKGQICNM